MANIRCIFVEKKKGFNVEAKGLLKDFKSNLGMANLEDVRVLNKYTISEISDEYYQKAVHSIFSEPTVDQVYQEELAIDKNDFAFGVEFLPGQFDQRANSAEECIELITEQDRIPVKTAKIIILKGKLSKSDIDRIKNYYINPVDSREVDIESKEMQTPLNTPKDVQILDGFIESDIEKLKQFHKEQGLAMSIEDILMIQDYFKNQEKREPSITEIKVIDTYWSDHCRHTTFQTAIQGVEIEDNKYTTPIKNSYQSYLKSRDFVYGNKIRNITLMDLAVIAMKELRKKGMLDDLDISEEINACSINID